MELKSSSPLHSTSTFDPTVDFDIHLFSSIVTLYILVFLYFPTFFLNIIFSPVFISTGVLLVYLLRLGAIQETRKDVCYAKTLQTNDPSDKAKQNQTYTLYETENREEGKIYADVTSAANNSEPSYNKSYSWDSCDFKFGTGENSFVEWNVKAPLEIIYEDDEEDDESENRFKGIERYPSLSLYYPESDTDCSSDDDFAMDMMNWEARESASATCRWDEMGEELIEIALDGKGRSQFFNDEEDSLIEIDIFPGRNNEFAGQY